MMMQKDRAIPPCGKPGTWKGNDMASPAIQRVLLYSFTGTGNSLRAAQWMAAAARQAGLDARVTALPAAPPADGALGPGALLGLLCPAHGFTAPWAMLRFALGLPRRRGARAFAAMPRGAMRLWRWTIPGMEGSGLLLLALILWSKGYAVRGTIALDMPGSWTALLPGPTAATAQEMLAAMQPRAEAFVRGLLAGETRLHGWLPALLGLLLLPLSFLYLIMGRFFLAKLFYASPRCTGCGLCTQTCPLNAVVMKQGRPTWTFLCESCTRCMNTCPRQAVEASYPFGALMLYVTSLPVAAAVLDALARLGLPESLRHSGVLAWIIAYPYKLLSLAIGYALFNRLLRVAWINRLLTALTPTRFYRRYITPEQ